jgi:hypothetical protein
MKNLIYLPAILIFVFSLGCSSSNGNQNTTPKNNNNLSVISLEWDEDILQGKLINKSKDSFEEVVIKITWTTPCGSRDLKSKNFNVVPGGDNKLLAPGTEKHFKYSVKLNWGGRRSPKLKWKILSVKKAVKVAQ